MKISRFAIALLLGLLGLTATGCVFPAKAVRWNGLHGPDGEPVYYVSATKVGLNLSLRASRMNSAIGL